MVSKEMIYHWHLIFLQIFLLLTLPLWTDGAEETKVSAKEIEKLRTGLSHIQEPPRELRAQPDQNKRLKIDQCRFPRRIQLFGQFIPLQRRDVWERMDKEFLLSVHKVHQVLLWMKRANRYFPFIESRLRSKELPEDLKYVAIVESALRLRAKSHAGAMGLWQFMPTTAHRYRLEKTPYVDERLDLVKSTDAALEYLQDLYELFGNWFLAVAAYNIGEQRIKKKLKRQQVTTYFDLFLPSETERFIFKIAAAKVILSNPRAYGFNLASEDLYDPIKVERVEARVEARNLDLVALAQASGMTFRSFMNINPHFRKALIPSGLYAFYVTPDKSNETLSFIKNFNQTKAALDVKKGIKEEPDPEISTEIAKNEQIVGIRNLKTFAGEDPINLNIKFDLYKLSPRHQIVRGRIMIVAETDRVSYPIKKRSSFAIRRFKKVEGYFKRPSIDVRFKKVTIFVYTLDKNLILKEAFPVEDRISLSSFSQQSKKREKIGQSPFK
jgi:soluble lytic murein transglycosylase-like protein